MSLPAGFTPELWEVWIMRPPFWCPFRQCTDGSVVSVHFNNLDTTFYALEHSEFPSTAINQYRLTFLFWAMSESECLAEVNAFAEKHGGWKDA